MSDFKTFKDTVTGKTGVYPAHYGERETFVEVDPDTQECIDCMKNADKVVDMDAIDASVDADAAKYTRAKDK